MENETSLDYRVLSLKVIPLILKVTNVVPVEGVTSPVDAQRLGYLDRIDKLQERFPIPEKFHLVSREVDKGAFRYDLAMTFESLENPSPFLLVFADVVGITPEKEVEQKQTVVLWQFHSPEPLSTYQLGHLVREHGETFPPACHPVFVGFELVGAYRGQS